MKLTEVYYGITDIYYDINEKEEVLPKPEIKVQAEKAVKNHPVYFFDSEEFHIYHQKNSKKVFRLIFMDGSSAAGFCYLGYTDDKLQIPYSAPFSDIYMIKRTDSLLFEKILACLKAFSLEADADLYLTLIPSVYDKNYAVKTGTMLDSGFALEYAHVSNYFDLEKVESAEAFAAVQSHSFRKNIKRAMKSDLMFHNNSGLDLYKNNEISVRAYDVIQKNRYEKDFPLAMSFDQIKAVEGMESSRVEYFLVSNDSADIAAAIVFKVSEEMVQVIYWGGLEQYSKLRPMEFLALSIIEHYKSISISYIDIGPSTANGRISHGLLAFKKNIGCETTLKMTFAYKEKSQEKMQSE